MLIAKVDGGFAIVASVSVEVDSCTYGGLLPGTTYRLVIDAVYYDGVGSPLVISVSTLPYTGFSLGTTTPLYTRSQ